MLYKRDPIIAQASAIGKAGVGVIRVSGTNLAPLLEQLSKKKVAARYASLIRLRDASEQTIDQGLLTFFPAPNSFTGEDVMEFHGHGGPVVIHLVMEHLLELGRGLGLRLAKPGEFSERAFLNNKIDLAQAEAIADLIDATTVAAVKSANRSLSGFFSEKINALIEKVTHLRMFVEATLDFPEEEIEFLENARAKQQWEDIFDTLVDTLKTSEQGALLRDGALVVLAGAPNVGKSSLLNQLAQQDIAIVTPIAGTTRDRIREQIQIEGIPISIVDTAGLREGNDEVERIGIERSWTAIEDADLIVFLRDSSQKDQSESETLLRQISTALIDKDNVKTKILEVWNKLDQSQHPHTVSQLFISAKNGDGIDELKIRIIQALGWESHTENTILARGRHIDALKRSLKHLEDSRPYLSQGNANLELFAEELRLAQDALGEITGKLLPDDLLGKIFSSFCIGK